VGKYAAFLRGMNVGGHRITSDELRLHFKTMGFADVACFRASGNVIFCAESEPLSQMTGRIEQGLEKALGYAVPTFLRCAGQLQSIAQQEPFPLSQIKASEGKLQVLLLLTKPSPKARKEVLALATDQDRLTFGDRELYWLPSGGILDSVLDLKAIGALLGCTTVRTKGTVEQIAKKHFAD
jgi:uncharacterized protein (DUF1697 family)